MEWLWGAPMLIECRDLSYRYDLPGSDWALRNIDLQIAQGERLACIGPAGSGKTTLIQLLDALVLPSSGQLLYDGIDVMELKKRRKLPLIRRQVGVLFQFPEHQFFQERAYDELAFALRNFFHPDEAEIERRAEMILGPLGLDVGRLREVSPFNLSTGEKRKLALASALMTEPRVLILDEPTAGMDAGGRQELLRFIDSLKDTTVILVTHNLEDFLSIIDRVVGLKDGRKVLDLNRSELFSAAEMQLELPLVIELQRALRRQGLPLDEHYQMDDLLVTLEQGLS